VFQVTYQKGFSIGGKASFSIGLPKVLGDGSIGVELDKQLQVRGLDQNFSLSK
jgi:hypothetical protein